MFDSIWKNIHIATMTGKDGYGIIRDAAIGITDGKITFAGAEKDLPKTDCEYVYDGESHWATPALIDCHTHLAYAGSRADEFEKRLQGISYADIAKAGGGILSTVRAVRDTSEDDIFDQTLSRISHLFREGVCAFEIKSGYGLDTDNERKLLRVATRVRDELRLPLQRTFLAAHAVPPEYAGNGDGYIDHICSTMMPALAAEGLIDAVDAFCEHIAFSPAQTAKVFAAAKKLNLPVKLHAEQLSDTGGATLAAQFGALSADHLEYASEDGIKAMAASGTVAVMLPGAFYYLREKMPPPVKLLRQYGVPMAVATDHNPGTSPVLSLLLMMNMASILFGLTPEESLRGVTVNAARALGWQDTLGTVEVGKSANIAFWGIDHPRDLVYAAGKNPCTAVVIGGDQHTFGE